MTATLATDTSTTTLTDVLGFVLGSAEQSDIERLYAAIKQRQQVLRAVKAAAVSEGATVKLEGLSPKYLNGLTGAAQNIQGQRCDVKLDETSTMTLRFTGRRFFVPPGVTNYVVTGVPLSCAGVQ